MLSSKKNKNCNIFSVSSTKFFENREIFIYICNTRNIIINIPKKTTNFSQRQQKGKYLQKDLYLHVSDKIGCGVQTVLQKLSHKIPLESRKSPSFERKYLKCLDSINIASKDEV